MLSVHSLLDGFIESNLNVSWETFQLVRSEKKPQYFFEPNNPLLYKPCSSRAIRFVRGCDEGRGLPREWEDRCTAAPPLSAHQRAGRGDTGACSGAC